MLDAVLIRLELGRGLYGPLDLAKPRDWQLERAEELVDAEVYRACGVIVDHDARLRSIDERPDDPIEAGLAELRDAPAASRPPAVDFTFYMPDEEREG